MRTTLVGLVGLPVLLGGIGLAAAAVYYSGTPSFSAEPRPTQSQNPDSIPGAGAGAGAGTSIDGRRPHLTVHDGNRLLLAGSLAGLHSARPIPVPPLDDDAPSLRNASSAGETAVPASARAPSWSVEVAVPPRQISTAPSAYSPAPATGGPRPVPPAQSPATPEPVRQPTEAAPPSVDTVETEASPSSGWRPDPVRAAGDATGPPPHARETGRPDHADTTGPPPHANANDNARSGRGRDSDTSAPR